MYNATVVDFNSPIERKTIHTYDDYDCILIYNDDSPDMHNPLTFICEAIPNINYCQEEKCILITSTEGTYRNIFYKENNSCWEDFLMAFSDLPSCYHIVYLKEEQYSVTEHYKIY